MKVTCIELHDVALPYHDWIAYELNHYGGPSQRTICIAHTDTGLIGLGEGRATEEDVDKYHGTNPFDWLGDDTSLALGTAMYDLMGKAARSVDPGCRWPAGRYQLIPSAWRPPFGTTLPPATPG